MERPSRAALGARPVQGKSGQPAKPKQGEASLPSVEVRSSEFHKSRPVSKRGARGGSPVRGLCPARSEQELAWLEEVKAIALSTEASAQELKRLPSALLQVHFQYRMAYPGPDRAETVTALGHAMRSLPAGKATSCLDALLRGERTPFRVYVLEVLDAILKDPRPFPPFERGPWIKNRRALENTMVEPGETVQLAVPLKAQVWGFAFRGGSRSSHVFAPGSAPGVYELEVGRPGRYEVLALAKMGQRHCLDEVRLWVEPK